jgi:hypothetical protein
MIPAEDDAESNLLIDGIIKHRIESIIFDMNNKSHGQAQELRDRKQDLQKSFELLNSDRKKWMWPRREGLDRINYSTQAPPGNAINYTPDKFESGDGGAHDIGKLWQGFVDSMNENNDEAQEHHKRLPVFHSICLRSDGRPVPRLPGSNDDGTSSTWKQLVLGQRGKWLTARELYETKMKGSPPARNLPLSTIPFVQN